MRLTRLESLGPWPKLEKVKVHAGGRDRWRKPRSKEQRSRGTVREVR